MRERVFKQLFSVRYNLVSKVESLESSIRGLLIAWRAYSTIYHAARTFISQMTSMVGTEPVESSNGNTALLPTYRVSEREGGREGGRGGREGERRGKGGRGREEGREEGREGGGAF